MGNKSTKNATRKMSHHFVEPFVFDYSLLFDDIWICIFEFIDTKKVAQTCKLFYELSKVAKHSFIFNQDPSIPPSNIIQYLSFSKHSSPSYHLNGSIWKHVSLEKLKIKDEELQKLLQVCPNIETLDLYLNVELTEACWKIIRDFAPKLKHLSIGTHLFEVKGLLDDTTNENTHLESLQLSTQHINISFSSTTLVRFRHLKHLTISSIQLEEHTCSTSLESICLLHATAFQEQPVLFSTVFPNVKSIASKRDMYGYQYDTANVYWEHFESLSLTTIDLRAFYKSTFQLDHFLSKQTTVKTLCLPMDTCLSKFPTMNVEPLQELLELRQYNAGSVLPFDWLQKFVLQAKNITKLHFSKTIDEKSLKLICIHLGPQLRSLSLQVISLNTSDTSLGSHFQKLESLALTGSTISLQHSLIQSLSDNEAIQQSLKQIILDHCTVDASAMLQTIPQFVHLEFLNLYKITVKSEKGRNALWDECVEWKKKFTIWFVENHQ